MKRCVILILLIVMSSHFVFAQQTAVTNVEKFKIEDESQNIKEVEEYLRNRQLILEKINNKKEPESSLRRFEVMFFTSGAMVYFSTFIFVKLFAKFSRGTSSELPYTYWYYIISNSAGIAAYIAIKDYYDVKKFRLEEEKRHGSIEQNTYRVSFLSQRF